MLEILLSKEEKKILSKRNLEKLKKCDFSLYVIVEEEILKSLKTQNSTHIKENPLTIEDIKDQKKLVFKLQSLQTNEIVIKREAKNLIKRDIDKKTDNFIKKLIKMQGN